MKQVLLIFILGLLVACAGAPSADPIGAAPPTTLASASQQPDATDDSSHIVVETSGNVSYMRQGWINAQRVRFGTILHTGDLLDRPAQATVVIICADLSKPKVEVGLNGVPCRTDGNVLTDGANELTQLRSESLIDIPLLMAPLPGMVRQNRPVIEWTEVQATTVYTVTLHDDKGKQLWQRVVPADKEELSYPVDAPALTPNVRYSMTIAADGNRTSVRAPDKQWIWLITTNKHSQVAADEGRIKALAISDLAKQVLLIRLWLHYDLNSDAEALLRTVVSQEHEIAILLLLAEANTRGLLYERAIDYYKQALTRAQNESDPETMAVASYHLGQIYLTGLPNPTQAQSYLTQAREHYRTLLGSASKDPIFEKIESDLRLIGKAN